MSKAEKAIKLFQDGYNCAQAVFCASCEDFGIDLEVGCRLSSGFGGGMHLGSTCGVVSGAVMVIGLKFGKGKKRPYDKTAEFAAGFLKRNISLQCIELLGCDVRTEEGMQLARTECRFRNICDKLVQDACEILEEMGV